MSYYDDDDYMTPQQRRDSRRRWAEHRHYEAFLERKKGSGHSFAWGHTSDGKWFTLSVHTIDRKHQTLEEFDSYQRIRIAMGEPDTALERWFEVRVEHDEPVKFHTQDEAEQYCRDNTYAIEEMT